jgi:putative component of membrane protein insertase Oxa1/YidC/SpoIIIJ protein YidD
VTAAALALAAIRCYQRFISPYKGFSCALRVATGGASCSAYGHAVIARFGLRRGLGLLRRRFELCGHVHARMHAVPPPHPRLKYQRGSCDVPCHGDCLSVDAATDIASCATDWYGAGSSRTRTPKDLDAEAERIRRQTARRTAPDPATPATESSPAAAD